MQNVAVISANNLLVVDLEIHFFQLSFCPVAVCRCVCVIVREKSRLAEDKNHFQISSNERSSAADVFQGLRHRQQSVHCSGSSSLPSQKFTRTSAVPHPPPAVENLHLSQMFRTSSSSSQPAADCSYFIFNDNTDSSEVASPFDDDVGGKENNFADLGFRRPEATVFIVPYKSSKPVAKVLRQETATATSSQQSYQRQKETVGAGTYQAGLNDVDLDNQEGSQKPTLYKDSRGVLAESVRIQPSFSRSATLTPFCQNVVLQSTANARGHVGDTPLALSGLSTH